MPPFSTVVGVRAQRHQPLPNRSKQCNKINKLPGLKIQHRQQSDNKPDKAITKWLAHVQAH